MSLTALVFAAPLLLIVYILLICLDAAKKIALTKVGVAVVFMIIAPHTVLLGNLFFRYASKAGAGFGWQLAIIIETALFFAFIWFKLNILPLTVRQEEATLRLKIMMGGRRLTLLGLFSAIIQIPLCIVGYLLIRPLHVAVYIVAADLSLTVFLVLFLLLNGVLRILFTSRRLSIIRRVIIVLTGWIPVINFPVLLYACHIVSLEFDHECYKVIRHNARVDSQVCSTRYPLVMVHGVGFRDFKYVNYWGRIPKELIRNGATVYYGNQEAWGTVEYNAADIKKRIMQVIETTGCGKVNIIAHSKGGLDARYAVSALGMSEYVASLTTMSTPHRGSKIIDVLCHAPDGIFRAAAKGFNAYYRFIGDKNPDFYTAIRQFSTRFTDSFNENVKDLPEVYYQSYASVMKSMFSDSLLLIPYSVIRLIEHENDGLVSIESAKWGRFRGVFSNKYRRGISHGDMIDLKREDYRGFDVIEKYMEIVSELKQMGY